MEGAAGKVEGYSPRERKEIQADVFAGELLCPANWLREDYVVRGRRPRDIARDLGLPSNLVLNQVIRALLLPPLRPAPPATAVTNIALDDSQKKAAAWDQGALLVDAGPGTGKTRTLVHRIKHYLDSGTTPSSILALTFSNKAAEEMRERLSEMSPDAAVEMWVGTFHAFGLELITKWPLSIGRSMQVEILDEAGALALLETNLAKLSLHHFQNLYEPAFELTHVLRAISRCKDELISPSEYRAEAQDAYDNANRHNDPDAFESAEKSLEIASIYEIYEEALREADAVDFGDLVVLATKLVETNPDVKAYISKFKYVHVDEYQDVNLASARFLQAICRTGATPWVVADQRQSIYRFRGAEPSNVSRFGDEFTGQCLSLTNNYRSFAPIVRTFEGFSALMAADGGMKGNWEAYRANGGGVTMTVAPTLAAEAESIRDKIEEFRAKGIPYSEQVILARTHLTLARITGILEYLNVPMLYLGDLFERKEIRDLLSLIALDSEFGNVGLGRIAVLSEYDVSRDDTLTVLQWIEINSVTAMDALNRLNEIPDVSAAGRIGLARLGAQLQGMKKASPWTLLTTWLFERSDYLKPLLVADDANSRQKLIAIYQLLKVCSEQSRSGDSSRKRFLARIRRLEALGQDSAYRAVSSEATDIDAVRVLTIHGSKGLEFGAVHFPALATKYMPTVRQGVRCPPPEALTQLSMQPGDHEAEEACLFFVGLSRARDFLSLSRAEKYTSQKANPSRYLDSVSPFLTVGRHNGSGQSFVAPLVRLPQAPRKNYPERELSVYMGCPARYRYEVIEMLRGDRGDSPYILFHRCVYITVGWLEAEREAGRTPNVAAGLARLRSEWREHGPVGHGFENYYLRTAEGMVRAMAHALAGEAGRYERLEWIIPVGNSHISVTPDRVLIMPDGSVRVQRIRTGRKTKSEPDNPLYALLRHGATIRYPDRSISVEILYLSTGDIVPVPAKNDGTKLQKYLAVIESIEGGDFHPDADPRACPTCQYYFTCGS